MSQAHTGNIQPSIDQEEHRSVNGTNAKAVAPYGFDGTNLNPQAPDGGTWGYTAGTAGTVTLTAGQRVLQITAIAEEAAATITINGGDTITLPYGGLDKVSSSITIEPRGNLVAPTIVFTSTKAYFVEYVS